MSPAVADLIAKARESAYNADVILGAGVPMVAAREAPRGVSAVR